MRWQWYKMVTVQSKGELLHKIEEFGLAFSVRIRYNDKCFRDVAQVVERYFREVEVASSSLVIPILESL